MQRSRVVGADIRFGQGQGQTLAAFDFAAEIAAGVVGVEVRIMGQQIGHVLCHNQVAVGRNHHVRGEGIIDALRELPFGKAHRVGAFVIEFDVLIVTGSGDRLVHDFIDHHVADQDVAVGRSGRFGC